MSPLLEGFVVVQFVRRDVFLSGGGVLVHGVPVAGASWYTSARVALFNIGFLGSFFILGFTSRVVLNVRRLVMVPLSSWVV